jgi:hypothetical protein
MISPLWIPIAGVAVIPVTVIGSIIAVAYARRLRTQAPVAAPLPVDVIMRLERMEQALDSIAVEVERISEGQRFTTRLLAERSDAPDVPTALPGGLTL